MKKILLTLLLLCATWCVARGQSPALDIVLAVTDGAGGSTQLRFGLDPSATDAIDAALGEAELPPSPPSGVFDARFIGDDISISLGQGSLKDYRQGSLPAIGTRIHEIKYQVGSGTSITISWTLPAGASGRLQDLILGTIVDVAMSGTGNYIVANPGGITKLKLTVTYAVAPTVVTGGVTNNIRTSAQLDGTVNPNNLATTYSFQYGATTSYGSATTTQPLVAGISAVAVNATITSLTPGATYHFRLVATNSLGTTNGLDASFVNSLTAVRSDDLLPTGFRLEQNYPNPFNPTTTIAFSVPREEMVTLGIYNELGQMVQILIQERFSPGNYHFPFDASKLASGIYVYRMVAGSFTTSKKLTLIR